jgi:hypothetical protein
MLSATAAAITPISLEAPTAPAGRSESGPRRSG